jgi:hypothetical protein
MCRLTKVTFYNFKFSTRLAKCLFRLDYPSRGLAVVELVVDEPYIGRGQGH